MRIVCISDTHNMHDMMRWDLPKGDVLIHAGDLSGRGREDEVTDFVHWYQNLKGFDTKIFIAGNHDFAFENINKPHHQHDYSWFKNLMSPENLSQSDVVYLEDDEFVIESSEFSRPIKFYGSPWQPEFYNWAFNLPRMGWELEVKWNNIPSDTDILITHGPPHTIRDFTETNMMVGCELLKKRVLEIKPLVHVFGHIHGAYGPALIGDTLFVNASTCTERYEPVHKPLVVELTEYSGEIVASYVEN